MGTYRDSSGNTEGLLLRETNGAWSAGVEVALPADAATTGQYVSISGVSCASVGDCSAVGTYVESSGNLVGLLLSETAGTWAPGVRAVLPADAASTAPAGDDNPPLVSLTSVSCAAPGNCAAVGNYLDASGQRETDALLLTETDGNWSPGVEATLPSDAPTADGGLTFLNAVSCASPGNCIAVGSYFAESGGVYGTPGLLLTETDGSWSVGVEAPLPPDAATATLQSVDLSSVSCASPGNCTAVGSYNGSLPEGLLLTERAGSWSAVQAPLPSNAASAPPVGVILDSVSCASAGNCSVVGDYDDSSGAGDGLLLSETDGSWSAGLEAVVPANAAGYVQIISVSCASPGNCTAVGFYNAKSSSDGVVLTQTAGSWSDGIEAAAPANSGQALGGNFPISVSCPSVGDCSAVGSYRDFTLTSQGLLLGGDPPAAKLEVSRTGTGSGTVSSQPDGIHCGSACSGSWGAGTAVTLTATAAPGSRFNGWTGGGCTRVPLCEVSTGVADQTVTAFFTLIPKCVVPRVTGKSLKAAEHAIRTRHCTVGKVAHAFSETVDRGRVSAQRPRSGRKLKQGAQVDLVVSKGPRS